MKAIYNAKWDRREIRVGTVVLLAAVLSSPFLYHLIRSEVVTKQLANLMIGSSFKRVNVKEIRSLRTPIPPNEEQSAIVSFHEAVLGELDSLVTEAEHAIELLEERLTALISAAVTGKTDVRKFARQETA